jgi:predicted O-methyltransferase YrrM
MKFTNLDFIKKLNLDGSYFVNNCVLPRKLLYGQIDDMEKNFMFNFVRIIKPKIITEYSTSTGYSTIVISNALKSIGLERSFFVSYEIDANLIRAAFNHLNIFDCLVTLIQGDVLSTMKYDVLKKSDFIHVDSEHDKEFCKKYIEKFFPHIKKEAWVAVHDSQFYDDGTPQNGETELIANYIKENNIENYFFIPDLLDMFNIANKEVNGTIWFKR